MRMGQSTGGSAPSTFDPQSVVHFDSRRHSGRGDLTLVNYGTGGSKFDLTVIEYAPGYFWAVKRLNWYSQGTTGNGIYPTSWADLGGRPEVAPWFYVVHFPSTFTGMDNMFTENEWYINCDVPGDVGFGAGSYIDYFDGDLNPDGFTGLYVGCNYEMFAEFYPVDYGPWNAGIRSSYADTVVAHYWDPFTHTLGFWIFDGLSMYSFQHTFVSNNFIQEDSTYEWLFLQDETFSGLPPGDGEVKHMFWSFAYHLPDLYGPLPGYGTPWGQTTGIALTRPNSNQTADLDTYVRGWWNYFSSDLGSVDLLNPDL